MKKGFFYTDQMSVGYDGEALIQDININVNRGEIVTLIGPNGSGKSTILKSMIAQLNLIGGTVVLDGHAMKDLTEKEIARRMSVLMTERVEPELMSCYEVVATGRYPYTGRFGILSAHDKAVVGEALELVRAGDLADIDFLKISDGQRQRILLARAICQEPSVIVLDEPTSYLDIRHKLELLNILKELVVSRKLAVVMSLHEIDFALKISDRIVCVNHQSIEKCGTPEEILRDDYLTQLFGVEKGSCSAFGCSPELKKTEGAPKVFVIGGCGSGIQTYRKLQRKQIPFAAGILYENDIDYPSARALAVSVVTEKPFETISENKYLEAKKLIDSCDKVIVCLREFTAENERLRQLAQYSKDNKKTVRPEELQDILL